MPIKAFEHNGVSYSVRPLTGLDKLDVSSLMLTWKVGEISVELGLIDSYKGTKEDFKDLPDYLFVRIHTFVSWMQVTLINTGKLMGISLDSPTEKLAKAYNDWIELVSDDELFNQWEAAYKGANLEEKDPLAPTLDVGGETTP